jgi:hypothetical protein
MLQKISADTTDEKGLFPGAGRMSKNAIMHIKVFNHPGIRYTLPA